jgi:hypothetical protein
VLRSTDGGTNRVHHRLKQWRAMLCRRANSPSSNALTSKLSTSGPAAPESIDLGTAKSPTNPIA